MNALFEVGAKLLGLYFVYRGVLALVDVAASLLSSLNQDSTGLGLYLVFALLAALVQVGAGGLLFSQTAWLLGSGVCPSGVTFWPKSRPKCRLVWMNCCP